LALFFLEKRASPLQNSIAPISQISELKGSPPAKKVVARRPGSIASPQEKSPLKGKSNRRKMFIKIIY
jgi:hypothetical protein